MALWVVDRHAHQVFPMGEVLHRFPQRLKCALLDVSPNAPRQTLGENLAPPLQISPEITFTRPYFVPRRAKRNQCHPNDQGDNETDAQQSHALILRNTVFATPWAAISLLWSPARRCPLAFSGATRFP